MHTKIGQPGTQCFRIMLDENDVINLPFTSTDDKIANDVWGKSVDAIKGSQVRQSQQATPKLDATDIPTSLKHRHHGMRLFIDAS